MGDAARPSDDIFSQVLQESLKTWSSYLAPDNENYSFPRQAIDLPSLVRQTPPFLSGSHASHESISFSCEEKQSTQGTGSLAVNGQSIWRTSKDICHLQPRVLSKQLLLAVGNEMSVTLSEDSPFTDWPGVQGLSNYDNKNYLSCLYLAWAYVFSARWVELLGRSVDHECQMAYKERNWEGPNEQHLIQVDIGEASSAEEEFWWSAILCSGNHWNATTRYNGRKYLSPWSVSATGAGLTLATQASLDTKPVPPDSATALKYLSRFCLHHRLYAQCSVALSGVLYIPFLRGRTISLPFPKQKSRPELTEGTGDSTSISDLFNEHNQLLANYMTLSLNIWGLRSILCSTFFNTEIECNLVSSWLNPAFAILDSISSNKIKLAALLINRHPRLGILWLGAIFTDLAKSILRDVRAGMTALDLPASAWTETTQTFLTSKVGPNNGESIRREDECRLLFITASEAHERPPIWPWKPFGTTKLSDAELSVRKHAQCAAHFLEYDSWEWILTDGRSIQSSRERHSQPPSASLHSQPNKNLPTLDDYTYDFFSQSLSEGATRGIFEWLRSTGYPCSERPIYQHSWIDLEGSDEEAPDDAESDGEIQHSPKRTHVERWLEGVEDRH